MLNLIIKMEILVDKALLRLGNLLIMLFKKLIPSKVRDKFFSVEQKVEKWLSAKKEKIWAKKLLIQKRVNAATKVANENIQLAQRYDYKSKITELRIHLIALVEKIKKLVKENAPKVLVKMILVQLFIPLKGLKAYTSKFAPKHILAACISSAIIVIAGFGIYFEGQKISATTDTFRSPAGEVEEGLSEQNINGVGRPSYYKKDRKQLVLTHVKLPIYYKDVNEIHTIDIEFSLQLNNRYSIRYLDNQEHALRDHLLQVIEPIVPTFPLEEEGKIILRDKIQYETNRFLLENKRDGQVEAVKIIDILGV